MTADKWATIRSEFESGATIGDLTKRHGVSIAEILKRAKAEGWTRNKPEPPAVVVAPPKQETKREKIERLVAEAAADIVTEHRSITRKLREMYHDLEAEYQAMAPHMVSFLDQAMIEQLSADPDPKKLKSYLLDAFKALGVKFGLYNQLINVGGQLIAKERTVWGLENTNDEPDALEWDDLLEKARRPATIQPLPDNVLRFERTLAKQEQT